MVRKKAFPDRENKSLLWLPGQCRSKSGPMRYLVYYGRLKFQETLRQHTHLGNCIRHERQQNDKKPSQALRCYYRTIVSWSQILRKDCVFHPPRGMLSSLNTSSGSQEGKERGCFSSTSAYSSDLTSRDFISMYLELSAKHEPGQSDNETQHASKNPCNCIPCTV